MWLALLVLFRLAMLPREPLYSIIQIARDWFGDPRLRWSVERWFKNEEYFDGSNGNVNEHRLYTEETILKVIAQRKKKKGRVA
jgi:hypothetical protein